MEEALSLSELMADVAGLVNDSFDACWVRAEINSMSVARIGHCYMDLVEKDPSSDEICASARATIWRSHFGALRAKFEEASGAELKAGIKVLVLAIPKFDERYGFSLNIIDIDGAYTAGDFLQQRRQAIQQLEKSGVMDQNKSLPLPSFVKRVAVISSAKAAGYQDFMKQLEASGYVFSVTLFTAAVQGSAAEAEIIAALDNIEELAENFEAVAIIRGGGSVSDLMCFDSFRLAYRCAVCSLPIISGIGHDKDVSVVDMVTRSVKTPTAAAQLLIGMAQAAEDRLLRLMGELDEAASRLIQDALRRTEQARDNLFAAARALIDVYDNRLRLRESELLLSSPDGILRKGYAMVVKAGEAVTAQGLQSGDEVELKFYDGSRRAVITPNP